MSTPLFMPIVQYVREIPTGHERLSLENLCDLAGVECRATGAWTQRQVTLIDSGRIGVMSEPRDGPVAIMLPPGDDRYKIALAVMAYSLHDLVARESIKNLSWARPAKPAGRPKSGKAMTGAERQERYRQRRAGTDS